MTGRAANLDATLIGFINSTYHPPTPVGRDTELVRSEIIDSYSIIEMIAFIETTCDARIPDEDVRPDNFRTVDAIIAMIGSLR